MAFKNRAEAKQLITFAGLESPNGGLATDIDCAMDFGGQVFIFAEAKFGDKLPPKGQKLFIERLIDAINKPAIYMIVSHNVADCTKDIRIADGLVTRYYYKGAWHKRRNPIVFREAVIDFRNSV